MTARRVTASLLALALAGCASPPAATEGVVAAPGRSLAAFDSLVAAGRIDEAVRAADADVRAAVADGAPDWRLREVRARAASLAREAAMPPPGRQALAAAAAGLVSARALGASDSSAAAADAASRAWRTRATLLGAGDLRTAEAAMDLAEAEFSLGHAGESDTLTRAALGTFVARLGGAHPRVADAEALLGRITKNYTGRIGFSLALDHEDRALRIRRAALGAHSLDVAASLHDLGNLYRLQARPREALALLGAALEIRRERLGLVHEDVASTLGAMAFLHSGRGEWAAAESLSRAALDATPGGLHGRIATVATRLALHGAMLGRLGRVDEAVSSLRVAAALRETIWARSAHDEASTVMSGPSIYRDLAVALAAQGHADEAFVQLDRGLSRSLADRIATASGADPWHDLIARLQKVLKPDEALVAWPRTTSTNYVQNYPIWACVVRADRPVRWFALPRREWPAGRMPTIRDEMWTEMRAACGWPRMVTETGPIERMARGMWREWFAPLEPALVGVRHIVVCTPELLAGGPLAALEDDRGRWIGERFRTSYAPSALVFLRARERAGGGDVARRPALLVGDPDYPDAAIGRMAHLAGAGEELRSLAAQVPHADLLTGARASAGALRGMAASGALARYGILHFAAHATNDPRRVFDAALLLSPDTPGGATSRLDAREIAAHWRLDADLVSLAACSSVEGLHSSTDGPMGLQQAFLVAGARSLLVTLWPVDDTATARLVREFYARATDAAHPVELAEALAQAQHALRTWRAPDGSHPYAHPAYWAAFALIGDPG